ncbi:transmembrane amino acid transporter protein-domain-containing protein [Umbelopsis sp. PMI_123]|nr:transmembrane amino acid transporter protein-domain-containing protein [Umbelopsis sp. PMI_123]
MVDYKPVQDLPDDVVEMLDEGTHTPTTLIDQQKAEIQEEDQDTTRHRSTASPSSAIVNLANTVLGSGMLAMPSAVASVGLIPAIFLILFAAATSALGLYYLSRCAARTEGRNASFFAVSQLTWPSAAIFFDLAIAIKCFGVSVSYLLIIGDLMPTIITSLAGISNQDNILLDRRFWITVFTVTAVVPLSFMRKLDSLKYTSVVSLFAVAYLCAIVIWHFSSSNFINDPAGNVEMIHFSTRFFRSLPVFVFAFTCHQNLFSVYNELKDNGKQVMLTVVGISIGSACFIYELIGALGYLSLGKMVHPNFILEYPSSMFVTGGRIALVVLNTFSYPLQAHPCRASLEKVIACFKSNTRKNGKAPPPTPLQFFAMTTAILICSYIVAITVTKLDLVLAFVGSTGSTLISFILPGLFYVKINENEPWNREKISALCLAIYGICVMVVCLTFNIVHIYQS